jgi:hypothetical protein
MNMVDTEMVMAHTVRNPTGRCFSNPARCDEVVEHVADGTDRTVRPRCGGGAGG